MATARNPLATLLTDFGTRDPYVAQMKGTLLSICPQAQVVDITHEVAPQAVLEAAFILAQAAWCFPKGTVHVAVVDPDVGGDRKILAAKIDGHYFLAPDNGLLSFVGEDRTLEELVAVRNVDFLPPPGAPMTFHGRDVFAPLAGRILNGLDLHRLGPQPETYKLLNLTEPVTTGDDIVGQVIYIDRFGNLISNIPAATVSRQWPNMDNLRLTCAGRDAGTLQGTYSFVSSGQPLAVINSMGLVEVAVNLGFARDHFTAAIGSEIRVSQIRP
jgi:S-adenosylmethionine hydrolase